MKRLVGDTRPVFVEVRGAFGYDGDDVSRGTSTLIVGDSLTVQSQREEADINVIMRRFGVTGQLPEVAMPPTFSDFGDLVFDFQSAQNMIVAARQSFMSLDAKVRSRFSNDPQEFVAFCSDPENLPEMRKMGLAIPEKKEDTTPVVNSKEKVDVPGERVGVGAPSVGDAARKSEGASG